MDKIKVMLGRNGYPAYFLDSCVRRFFNRKYDKMLSHHEERKNSRTVSSSSSSVFYSTTIKVHRNNAYHDIRPKKR